MLLRSQLWKLLPLVLIPLALGGASLLFNKIYKDKPKPNIPRVETIKPKVEETEEDVLVKELAKKIASMEEVVVEEEEEKEEATVQVKVEEVPVAPVFDDVEIVEEEKLPIDPKMEYVVLNFGGNNARFNIAQGKMGTICKLSGEETGEWCSFAKIEPTRQSNWMDYATLVKIPFAAVIDENFFKTPKTLYKARVSQGLIDKWNKDQSKKLEVYKINEDDRQLFKDIKAISFTDKREPLIILKPSFAFQSNPQKQWGKSHYYIGNLKTFITNPVTTGEEIPTTFDPSNKWFKCSVLGKTEATEKCFIYEFDGRDETKGAIKTNKLKLPLAKTAKIDQLKYYIIKFLEPQSLKEVKWDSSQTIKVDVFPNQSRTTKESSGIVGMEFSHLSNFVIHHEEWEAGVAMLF